MDERSGSEGEGVDGNGEVVGELWVRIGVR